MNAAAIGPNPRTQIGQRLVSEEPMVSLLTSESAWKGEPQAGAVSLTSPLFRVALAPPVNHPQLRNVERIPASRLREPEVAGGGREFSPDTFSSSGSTRLLR